MIGSRLHLSTLLHGSGVANSPKLVLLLGRGHGVEMASPADGFSNRGGTDASVVIVKKIRPDPLRETASDSKLVLGLATDLGGKE